MNAQRIAIFMMTRMLLMVVDCFIPTRFKPVRANAATTATALTENTGKSPRNNTYELTKTAYRSFAQRRFDKTYFRE